MEEWKDIPGYEGIYQASTNGRIRTAEGKTTWTAKHGTRVWKQRIMKQKFMTRKGTERKDARICLWKDGTCKTLLVSRVVALTWCAGYADGLTVNHIDGNPENNRAENLEWVSLADNIRLGFENGLYKTQIPCWIAGEDGNVRIFRSHGQASRFLQRDDSYISNCIKRGRNPRSCDGHAFMVI